ncbi:MAG: N-acetylmuramic acid 6-phosphate etherase [Hyphomicrobiales bacterium]
MATALITEHHLKNLAGFDAWDDARILDTLQAGQERAIAAVRKAAPQIAAAARCVATQINAGGRLAYAGAGTSLRIGVQDGAELPATFGLEEDRLLYLLAGGRAAIFETLADAEDDAEAGRKAASVLKSSDVLIAVAASGRTPYTVAAAEEARARGCPVIAVVNNAGSPLAAAADVEVVLGSGPEIIAGSTRMGAGTAQKAALNMISTLAFTRLGAVHDGYMVNVQAGNEKLRQRAAHIVAAIAHVELGAAELALTACHNQIKPAVLLCKGEGSYAAAQEKLAEANGNLRLALSKLEGRE